MKIAILSNVNLDMLSKALSKRYEVFESEGYGGWAGYALRQDESLAAFSPEIIFLIVDGNALLSQCDSDDKAIIEIDNAFRYINAMAENYKGALVAVSDIDVMPNSIQAGNAPVMEALWEARWSNQLSGLCKTKSSVVRFPLKKLIDDNGRNNIYSPKMWYMGSIPYSVKSLPVFGNAIDGFVISATSVRKKVLITDLDNTIWGGVVGEDGPLGLDLGLSKTGAIYRDVQIRLKRLKETGVLLVAVSKNNPEDVDEVFRANGQMVLSKDDFVAIVCNWERKSVNIIRLAEKLNLGIDSFVFLDDNPVERAEVKAELPEVSVVDFPDDIANLPRCIEDAYQQYFWISNNTEEDLEKTKQYQQEQKREEVLKQAGTFEDYLRQLDIHVLIGEVQESQIDRTVQLINKTNQFNTNTLRFDNQGFRQFLQAEGHRVFVANVSDRYGDSGLVFVLMLHFDADKEAWIDNMLMSCRVMGRTIENAIVKAVAERLYGEGVPKLHASWQRSGKNKPVEMLYDRLGFSLISSNTDSRDYVLVLPGDISIHFEAEWRPS